MNEWPIDEGVDETEAVASGGIGKECFVGKSCVAPDVLSCFAFEAYKQFQQRFGVVKGVATGECNAIEQCIAVYLIDNAR